MFQHLDPQISLGSLIGDISTNYSIAISYYSQRREQFLNFLQQNQLESLNFENELNKVIEEKWDQGIRKILLSIYFGNKYDEEKRILEVKKQFNTSPYLPQLIQAMKKRNPKDFFMSLGFVFEEFAIEDALNPVFEKIGKIGSQQAENLVSAFSSGAMKSLASVVQGYKNIRPDALVTLSNISFFEDENKILREKTSELPVELQGNLNINWEHAIPTPEEIMEREELLQEYLSTGNFFGFSMKTWRSTDSKHFMQSSVLQKGLNNIFNKTDKFNLRHSWEIDYTSEYVAYFLSHHIFDIVGPTDIAMFTGMGVIWMDDFLSQHIFYMRVQISNILHDRSAGEGRIFPQIEDSKVYIRNYNSSKAIIKMKSNIHKTKNAGNYIDLALKF